MVPTVVLLQTLSCMFNPNPTFTLLPLNGRFSNLALFGFKKTLQKIKDANQIPIVNTCQRSCHLSEQSTKKNGYRNDRQ